MTMHYARLDRVLPRTVTDRVRPLHQIIGHPRGARIRDIVTRSIEPSVVLASEVERRIAVASMEGCALRHTFGAVDDDIHDPPTVSGVDHLIENGVPHGNDALSAISNRRIVDRIDIGRDRRLIIRRQGLRDPAAYQRYVEVLSCRSKLLINIVFFSRVSLVVEQPYLVKAGSAVRS